MKRLKLVFLGAAVLFLLSGCPSYLTMQSTRTVEPGQVEFSAAGGRFFTFGGQGPLGNLTGLIGPTQLEGAARFGLLPDLDVGLRLRLADLGVSGGLKLRFLNLEKFQMAVAGEIGTSLWAPVFNALSSTFLADRDISAFLYWIDAALLGGTPLDDDTLLFFGPKFKLTNYTLNNISNFFGGTGGSGTVSASSTQIQPGLVFGADVSMKGGTRVLPEIDAFYDVSTGAFIIQLGATLALGGHKKKTRTLTPPPPPPALSPTPEARPLGSG